MAEDHRSFIEKVIAQWPGALAFLLIGGGVWVCASAQSTSYESGGRLGIYMIAAGMGSLVYWTFFNRSDNCNF